jgi:hypothetical protein
MKTTPDNSQGRFYFSSALFIDPGRDSSRRREITQWLPGRV